MTLDNYRISIKTNLTLSKDIVISILTGIHILAGAIGLISGAVALVTKKGSRLHRVSGMVFVASMLPMALIGSWLAIFVPERITVIAGLLTAYFVVTSLISAKSKSGILPIVNWLSFAAIGATAGASLYMGTAAQLTGVANVDGFPPLAYYVFGGVAALAGILDLIVLIKGGIVGTYRITRHLWRMCFALLIAVASFFLGQEQVFPEALQGGLLLASPVILTLAALVFWVIKTLYFPLRRSRQ